MFDEDLEIRQKALAIIMNIWRENKKKKSNLPPRQLLLPKAHLNFNAQNYFNLLNFNVLPKKFLTEPPMLAHFTTEALQKHATNEEEIELPNVPCHNVHCERGVQNTTAACSKSIGKEKQKSAILITQDRRKKITTNCKKSLFLDL